MAFIASDMMSYMSNTLLCGISEVPDISGVFLNRRIRILFSDVASQFAHHFGISAFVHFNNILHVNNYVELMFYCCSQ